MVSIFLQKIDPSGNVILSYECKNFGMLDIHYNLGVTPNPLPENSADQLVLVKVTGNSLTKGFSWIIKENANNQIVGSLIPSGTTINSIWDQLNFFDRVMQPTSVNDVYRFVIADSFTLSGNVYSPAPLGYFYKEGLIDDMKFSISSDQPTFIKASIDFQVGNIVSVWQSDTPSEPLNLTTSSPLTGEVVLNWNTPLDTGGSSITGYIIQRKQLLDPSWTTVTTTGVVLTYTDTGLTSGKTYYYQVAAINSQGQGEWTADLVSQLVT